MMFKKDGGKEFILSYLTNFDEKMKHKSQSGKRAKAKTERKWRSRSQHITPGLLEKYPEPIKKINYAGGGGNVKYWWLLFNVPQTLLEKKRLRRVKRVDFTCTLLFLVLTLLFLFYSLRRIWSIKFGLLKDHTCKVAFKSCMP